MIPKCIIIKSLSKNFISILSGELEKIPSIRFFSWKINGMYVITIKCYNYYGSSIPITKNNFYGSYIYLYTNLALLLAEFLVQYYERNLLKRILKSQYFYFCASDQEKILNISDLLLNENLLLLPNNSFHLERKEILVSSLLENFRHKNYINIDSFINFSMPRYNDFLEEILSNSINVFLIDKDYMDLIRFIIQNLLY